MAISAKVEHVPRHFTITASLTPASFLTLMQALAEFDDADLSALHAEMVEAWGCDVPQPVVVPDTLDDDDGSGGSLVANQPSPKTH